MTGLAQEIKQLATDGHAMICLPSKHDQLKGENILLPVISRQYPGSNVIGLLIQNPCQWECVLSTSLLNPLILIPQPAIFRRILTMLMQLVLEV